MTRGQTKNALRQVGHGLRELSRVRWVRVLTVLFVLAVGVRAGMTLLLARTLDHLASERGLECSWDDLSLRVLGGRGELRGLRIAARDDDEAPALIALEYAVFDLELLALFTGKLRVLRAEVDGIDARLERDAAGEWNFERHVSVAEVLALLESTEAEPEEDPEEEEQPLDLSLPVALDALRFQDAHLILVDNTAPEPRELKLEVNLAVSHFNTRSEPARFSLTVTAGYLLDGVKVEGVVRADRDALLLSLEAQAGSLRLGPLAPYLAHLDLRPGSEAIEATCRAEVRLEVVGERRDALSANASLLDVALIADGQRYLALERIELGVERISAAGARLAPIEITGPEGRVELLADGAVRIAGIDLLPASGPVVAAPVTEGEPDADLLAMLRPGNAPRWASLFLRPDGDPYPWSLAGVRVSGGGLELIDHATDPPNRLALEIETIELGELDHAPLATGTTRAPIPYQLRLHAPRLARDIQLDGNFQPFAPERSFEATLTIDGIGLEGAEPYLNRAGLAGAVEQGSLRVAVEGQSQTAATGRTRAAFAVREVALDGEGKLFGMRSIAVDDIEVDPDRNLVRVGSVVLEGPRLELQRDPSREFLGFGLRVLGRTALDASASTPETEASEASEATEAAPPVPRSTSPAPDTAPGGSSLPRLRLDRLTWSGSEISFVDHAAEPPIRIVLDELGFELTGLELGGRLGDVPAAPAVFRGQVAASEIAGEITVEGTLLSRPGPLDLEATLALRGTDLRGEKLSLYMRQLGIDPRVTDGRLQLDASARLREVEAGLRADAQLRDVRFADGDTPLVTLEQLELQNAVAGPTGLSVEKLAVVRPTLYVETDAGGELSIASLRFVAPDADAPVIAAAQPAPLALPLLPELHVERLTVEQATIAYRDQSLTPALDTALIVDVEGDGLDTSGAPGRLVARLRVPEAVEELSLDAELTLGAEELRLTGRFTGNGLRAGPFASLLPPGVAFDARHGKLEGELTATARAAPDGGLQLGLHAGALRWGTPDTDAWFACERARCEVSRLDPLAGTIELGAVQVEGVRVALERDEEGALHAFGATLGAPPDAGRQAPRGVALEASTPVTQEAAAVTRKSVPPPHLELTEGIELELERFAFRDASLGPDARTFAGNVRFTLDPAVVLDPAPAELPPLAWRVEGALEGLVESWKLEGELAPFAAEPRIEARFLAQGVRTAGLVELAPALTQGVRGDVDAGQLTAALEASFYVRRAREYELGLERAFGAEARLSEVFFRDAPEGDILLGVDEIQLDVKRVDPAKGLVHVESVEVRTPRLTARRDAEGLHALGLTVALEPAPGDTGEAARTHAESGPAPADTQTVAADAPDTPNQPPTGELRVDRFTLAGLAVELEDTSVDPPVRVPLYELDAELRRFTTRAFHEQRPVQFNAFLSTGEDEDEKPLFEELVASGRVAFHPEPAGWAQVQLAGLELTRFAGLVAEQGVELEDGALDTGVRVRLLGSEGMQVNASLVFTDLALEEPEGGPLESALALPLSLNSALFVLRNASGEHRISAGFTLEEDGISTADIALAATRALTEVLASALAGAPLRLLTAFTPGSEAEERPRETHAIAFFPGTDAVVAGDRDPLAQLAKRLGSRRDLGARLRYELGAEDLALAEILANPAPADCLELSHKLRARKVELDRSVIELRLETRALYAIGSNEAAASADRLRSLHAELSDVEHSLDQVLEVLHAESPRQRHKRTRTLARKLGELRLETIAARLRAEMPAADFERIEVGSLRASEPEVEGTSRVSIEIIER